jgi:hypothetical protein
VLDTRKKVVHVLFLSGAASLVKGVPLMPGIKVSR